MSNKELNRKVKAINYDIVPPNKNALPRREYTTAWNSNPSILNEMAGRVSESGLDIRDPEYAYKKVYAWMQENAYELNNLPRAQVNALIRKRIAYEQGEHAKMQKQYETAVNEELKLRKAEEKEAASKRAALELNPDKLSAMMETAWDNAAKEAQARLKETPWRNGMMMIEDPQIEKSGVNPYYQETGTAQNKLDEDGNVNPNWRAWRPANPRDVEYHRQRYQAEIFDNIMDIKLRGYGYKWNPQTQSPELIKQPGQAVPGQFAQSGTTPQSALSNLHPSQLNDASAQADKIQSFMENGQRVIIKNDEVSGKPYLYDPNAQAWEPLLLNPPNQEQMDMGTQGPIDPNLVIQRAYPGSVAVPLSPTGTPGTVQPITDRPTIPSALDFSTSDAAPWMNAPTNIPVPPKPRDYKPPADIAASQGYMNYVAPEGGTYQSALPEYGDFTDVSTGIPEAPTGDAFRSFANRMGDTLQSIFIPRQY